jgi:hypothetical protein
VRVASVPFDRIGIVAGRDGSVIEVFHPTFHDIILSEQQPVAYQKPFLISRTVKVDGRIVTVDDVLKHYWDESEMILRIIRKNSKV